MVRDPNWLYSTTAQSTAALVAIIGGFLVSRVITMATSREGLARQLVEVRRDLERLRPRLDDVEADLLADDAEDFIADSQDWILAFANQGRIDELTAEVLVDQGVDAARRHPLEYEPALRVVVERVRDAQRAIADIPSTEWPSTADEMRQRGEAIDEDDEWIWEGLLAWRDENKPRRPQSAFSQLLGSDFSMPRMTMPSMPSVMPAWRIDLQRERIELHDRIAGLSIREEEAQGGLTRLRATAGLEEPIWILVGFALVGLVYPLVLLAWDPVPDHVAVRVSVVALFTAGLAALVRYFVSEIRRVLSSGEPTAALDAENRAVSRLRSD